MTFPFAWKDQELFGDDLLRLAGPATRSFFERFPCRAVHFFALHDQHQIEPVCPAHWQQDLSRCIDKQRPRTADKGGLLFLPIFGNDGPVGGAVVEGREEGAFYQFSHEQLTEASRHISREIGLLKDWAVDPVTGLLSGRCFHEELCFLTGDVPDATDAAADPFIIVLLEVFPRTRNAEQGLHYLSKAAAYLDSLIGHYSPLYHFGAGVFAMLWHQSDPREGVRMAEAVLRWLKREEFGPVHIGITAHGREQIGRLESADRSLAERLLDQAWQSLRTARQRGPYALCSFVDLASRERRLLTAVASEVKEKFQELWRPKGRFSVALLHRDQAGAAGDSPGDQSLSEQVLALLGPELPVVVLDDQEVYVFLADVGAEQARQWAEDFRQQARVAADATFSVGIACYPCRSFKKADMVLNARKALMHAAFFGPASHAIFDGVSCNISGDVFYNSGDLVAAIREYRRGLGLDSRNVNILNSLGVAYAQKNRFQSAVRVFEAALAVEPGNFMALFNLAFVYLDRKKDAAAEKCFRRALGEQGDHLDLLIQLARFYCRRSRHEEAVPLLEKAQKLAGPENGKLVKGAIQRYLGEARMAQGATREAMIHLERATGSLPRKIRYPRLLIANRPW